MGQITIWIEQFHQGLITRDALIEHLEDFDLKTPERFAGIPADVFEAEAQAEDRTYEDEDTMDEVLVARDRGLLTAEDLAAIYAAMVTA